MWVRVLNVSYFGYIEGGIYPAAVLNGFEHIMSGGMYLAAVLNGFEHIMSGGMYPAAVLNGFRHAMSGGMRSSSKRPPIFFPTGRRPPLIGEKNSA